jgi:hypothetical protein
MQIPDLIYKISTLFPNAFKDGEARKVWTEEYHVALREYEGAALARAWSITMQAWNKGWQPRPADILANVQPLQSNAGGVNFIDWDFVDRRVPQMMAEWLRNHPTEADQARKEGYIFHLEYALRKKAHFAAQRESRRHNGAKDPAIEVEISAKELAQMRFAFGSGSTAKPKAPPKGFKKLPPVYPPKTQDVGANT